MASVKRTTAAKIWFSIPCRASAMSASLYGGRVYAMMGEEAVDRGKEALQAGTVEHGLGRAVRELVSVQREGRREKGEER